MALLKPRPIVLIIRDGWGANPFPHWNHANAVHLAHKPVDDMLMAQYPHVQVVTHGRAVGLPAGVMGNSEVGHQNIGAGRIVSQEIMRISQTIETGEFFQNKVLHDAYAHAAESGGDFHVMGLCSDAGVHSALDHLFAILETARRVHFDGRRVHLHFIADGRDTPPFSGVEIAAKIESEMNRIGAGRIASVIGRFYAMDRDNRWDRVETAYGMYVDGKGTRVGSAMEAFRRYYDSPTDPNRKGDEFITPTVIAADGSPPVLIKDGDSVLFFNFRGDRPREIIKAFRSEPFPFSIDSKSCGFDRGRPLDIGFATLTAYESGLPVDVMFPKPAGMINIFGRYVSDRGLTQFRCAETEKYAHVTFFFNDYREEPFPGEQRLLIPSPRDVATYDQKPEMSAPAVADAVVKRIESGESDVYVVNFANGDMVGHTGNLPAAVKAVEAVDRSVGQIVDATLRAGGALIVTADHGNCEQMIDPKTDQPHTAHTTYDVELIVVGDSFRGRTLRPGGCLADIAPTLVDMMDQSQPSEMTGRSLLKC